MTVNEPSAERPTINGQNDSLHMVADEAELALRNNGDGVGIVRARDWTASLRATQAGNLALSFACLDHEVAEAFVYPRSLSLAQLNSAEQPYRRLVGASLAVENLQAREVPQ